MCLDHVALGGWFKATGASGSRTVGQDAAGPAEGALRLQLLGKEKRTSARRVASWIDPVWGCVLLGNVLGCRLGSRGENRGF